MRATSRLLLPLVSALVLLLGVWSGVRVSGQGTPTTTLTVLSRDVRRELPLTTAGGEELVALDDLAALFQLAVREEGGALTITANGRTIALTPDQTIASVAGRVISLSAPPQRIRNRWMVPLDFIPRALIPITEVRLELRRLSHLLIVGDLRVPRVAVQQELVGANAGRITLESTPRAAATVTQDPSGSLTIRFEADAIDVIMPVGVVPGFVQGYRRPDPVTIGVDLGPRVGTTRNTTQIVDASTRLVIDLLPPADAAAPPATTSNDVRPPPPGRPSFASAPTRTLTIDAGHGGDDAGAKGAKGTLEKDVTLAIARRLRAAIESRLGFRVLMTRDDDRGVPVTERTALANNNKADLFISLHANASFRHTTAGATVYVASFETAGQAPALVPETLPVFGGGLRDIEMVPWNLAQIRHRDRSLELAGIVVDQFRDRVPLAAQPSDRAPLRVLESANMPAVLVELGYLTNDAQEGQLANADFQALVAQSLLDAIARFTLGATSEGQ